MQGAAEAGLYIADNRPVRLPSPQALSEYRKLIGGAKIANVTLDERTANVGILRFRGGTFVDSSV